MRITSRILLAIFVSSFMVSNSNASTVIGDITCQQWQDRQNHPADGESYKVWLNGYLSGADAMYGDMLDRDFIKNSDKISIVDWSDVYCKKHPEAMLHDSANALIKLLKRDMPF
ncbi:hypothetical protein [Sideroxydans lithotrophicus]|uniref:Uncharacterized protein n=1 Tax=Sideroxydans lithotrophicus (strain ES-1) TaxID=580332 RepID=D5CQ68_SIDLE|nr:hypothetical protein [Sideroxydans lithotrophicus]ADE11232.1 hypothetical protein Slit_0994 [Sideroxydans lithotrophicus ES-1]